MLTATAAVAMATITFDEPDCLVLISRFAVKNEIFKMDKTVIKPFEYKTALIIFFVLFSFSCNAQKADNLQIITGAAQTEKYLPLLKNKSVALVVNQTSLIGNRHLLDTLLAQQCQIKKVFAPEHGFRGNHEAGATVKNEKDSATGVDVISLYGKNKKPTKDQLKDIDFVIFDIQDVGVRFYTYISTLHYIMEACAESNKKLIILDRPNPNGFYIDGPVLDTAFRSFVGMHPVPVVHGLTVAEYAQMINGEKWLKNGLRCDITVIPVLNYSHQMKYQLPIYPSPNLKNMTAIYLYPATCFFEGTSYSLGRGTNLPFECAGRPGLKSGNFNFTPVPIPGVAENPPHANKVCQGYLYSSYINDSFFLKPNLMIQFIIDAYRQDDKKDEFFIPFFDKLAGTGKLKEQIKNGLSEDEIRASWQKELSTYKVMSKKYRIYN
jgi:uncharacterized protein YbbC (DUF1343 family)